MEDHTTRRRNPKRSVQSFLLTQKNQEKGSEAEERGQKLELQHRYFPLIRLDGGEAENNSIIITADRLENYEEKEEETQMWRSEIIHRNSLNSKIKRQKMAKSSSGVDKSSLFPRAKRKKQKTFLDFIISLNKGKVLLRALLVSLFLVINNNLQVFEFVSAGRTNEAKASDHHETSSYSFVPNSGSSHLDFNFFSNDLPTEVADNYPPPEDTRYRHRENSNRRKQFQADYIPDHTPPPFYSSPESNSILDEYHLPPKINDVKVLAEEDDMACGKDEFKCLQLNLNQILSINDWNRRPRECIPQSYRCDGRHDCQDGSDEVECFIQLPKKDSFRCFVGVGDNLVVEDCLTRTKTNKVFDPRETSRSVTELKEWSCSKVDRPDGTVIRDCQEIYTGGEAFRVCYVNKADGSTCLCSKELCNSTWKISTSFFLLGLTTAFVIISTRVSIIK